MKVKLKGNISKYALTGQIFNVVDRDEISCTIDTGYGKYRIRLRDAEVVEEPIKTCGNCANQKLYGEGIHCKGAIRDKWVSVEINYEQKYNNLRAAVVKALQIIDEAITNDPKS